MPPTFTKSLKRVDANVGNDVCMDCRVSGSQPMTVVWFKDEYEVQTGSKYQPEFKDNSATLHIFGLQKNDSGVYKCRATNSAGFKETSGTLYVKGHKAIQHSAFAYFWFVFVSKQERVSSVAFQSPRYLQSNPRVRMFCLEPLLPSRHPSLEQLHWL